MNLERTTGAFFGARDENSIFNSLLHEIRGAELVRMNFVPDTMVSVGASDAGYYNWIAATLGRPKKHIGLEAYRAEPQDLPAEAQWIANTAGNMENVADCCADLVFAGQTIEHLWGDELVNFLLEAHRVLKPGGMIVLDSPNRLITSKIKWNHPEHTLELTPNEMRNALVLAGFTVKSTAGHWLVDYKDRELALTDVDVSTLAQRIILANDRPNGSFSWWIIGEKQSDSPVPKTLKSFLSNVYKTAWPERLTRMCQTAATTKMINEEKWATSSKDWSGPLVFGPNIPIAPGKWRLGLDVASWQGKNSPGIFDVYSNETQSIISSVELPPNGTSADVMVELETNETLFGIEIRLFLNGHLPLTAKLTPRVEALSHNACESLLIKKSL